MSLFFPRITLYPNRSTFTSSPCGAQSRSAGCRRRYQPQPTFNPFLAALDSTISELSKALDDQEQEKTFNPRFDVREVDGSKYVLEGELPGVQQEDIAIEFLDEATLRIMGHRGSGSSPASPTTAEPEAEKQAEAEKEQEQEQEVDDDATLAEKPHSHHATVEDEKDEWIDVPQTADTEHSRPASSPSPPPSSPEPTSAPSAPAAEKSETAKARKWLSERSHGSFTRVFRFEGRVNRDEVSAALKNGVLTVVVPKAKVLGVKRVEVQ